MLNTSHDILNIVLAISIGAVAFFICWGLFYIVMVGRQIRRMMRETGEIVTNIKDTTIIFKEKVEHSASYFSLIAEGFKKLIELVTDKEKKSRKAKS